jgi:amicyanin
MRTTFVIAALTLLAAPAHAQSTLFRPPNLGGTWTPDPGVVQFDFIHRFYVAPDAGGHKVTNFPTFTLALGLPQRLAIGLHYGTNSSVVTTPYRPNETELYARWRPIGREGQDGFAVSVEPAYNLAAHSIDGEASVDFARGRLTLSGAVRTMSKAYPVDTAGAPNSSRTALAAGATLRLTDYIGISGDVGGLVSPSMRKAWGVAIDFVIPGSPHTFSLQASNVQTGTIQGSSVGASQMLYGFEFTIPLHLGRFGPWFHGSPAQPGATGSGPGALAGEVRMVQLKFAPDSITISAGQTVTWANRDPLEHTVTFEGDSAAAPIAPNSTFSRRFDTPGVYRYHCTPHPFMRGVVVVR